MLHRSFLALAVVLAVAIPLRAERPSATQLLPKETALFVQVVNASDLTERFMQTAVGRIAQDPQLKPLVGQLYGSAIEALTAVEEQLDLSVAELAAIPQGEIALAVVAHEDRLPMVVAMLEAGEQVDAAKKLLARAEELLQRRAFGRRTIEAHGTAMTVYDMPGNGVPRVVLFERDRTIVVCTDEDLAAGVLARWSGKPREGDATLASNGKFGAIMDRCRTGQQPPQAVMFFDPIALARSVSQGNIGAQTALALLPITGLDGMAALGGTVSLSVEGFDMVIHGHVLLDEPREGALKALSLEPVDPTPPNWVPADVAGYTTFQWDAAQTYHSIADLVDLFSGAGTTERFLERRLEEPAGINFKTDVLGAVQGRVVHIRLYEQPARLTSEAQLIAVELKDAEATGKLVDRLADRFSDRLTKKRHGDVTYYELNIPQPPADAGQDFTPPAPCVAVMNGWLMVTREDLLKRAANTRGDAARSLASSAEYKLIWGRIDRLASGRKPAMISYDRPEEAMRFLYNLAGSEDVRSRLQTAGQNNRALQILDAALRDNPLPPFAVIQQYLAPGGAFVVDDESGIHYTGFVLRRE